PGRLVVAVTAHSVLDARITPLLLDHSPDTVEVVVVLRIGRIKRDRLALDARPSFSLATGASRPRAASAQRRPTVDQRLARRRHGRNSRRRACPGRFARG